MDFSIRVKHQDSSFHHQDSSFHSNLTSVEGVQSDRVEITTTNNVDLVSDLCCSELLNRPGEMGGQEGLCVREVVIDLDGVGGTLYTDSKCKSR